MNNDIYEKLNDNIKNYLNSSIYMMRYLYKLNKNTDIHSLIYNSFFLEILKTDNMISKSFNNMGVTFNTLFEKLKKPGEKVLPYKTNKDELLSCFDLKKMVNNIINYYSFVKEDISIENIKLEDIFFEVANMCYASLDTSLQDIGLREEVKIENIENYIESLRYNFYNNNLKVWITL